MAIGRSSVDRRTPVPRSCLSAAHVRAVPRGKATKSAFAVGCASEGPHLEWPRLGGEPVAARSLPSRAPRVPIRRETVLSTSADCVSIADNRVVYLRVSHRERLPCSQGGDYWLNR